MVPGSIPGFGKLYSFLGEIIILGTSYSSCDVEAQTGEYFRSVKEIGEGELNSRNLVSIKLRSEKGWNQMSAFVCIIMRRKIKTKWMKLQMLNATPQ